jgi:hypothetical protein
MRSGRYPLLHARVTLFPDLIAPPVRISLLPLEHVQAPQIGFMLTFSPY